MFRPRVIVCVMRAVQGASRGAKPTDELQALSPHNGLLFELVEGLVQGQSLPAPEQVRKLIYSTFAK